MFEEIEKLYKEKAEINIITRKIFIIYWIIIGGLWFFGIENYAWISFFMITITILIILALVMARLKVKIEYNKKEKKCIIRSLRNSIRKQEYELIKEHLINNKMMDIENVKNIICHYRKMIKTKVKKVEFISILSLIIPIVFSIIDDNGIKIDIINTALPYILAFLIIYVSYRTICYFINTFKGEDGMYERLEEIFSEILVELINEENKKIKSTNSREKKKKI